MSCAGLRGTIEGRRGEAEGVNSAGSSAGELPVVVAQSQRHLQYDRRRAASADGNGVRHPPLQYAKQEGSSVPLARVLVFNVEAHR